MVLCADLTLVSHVSGPDTWNIMEPLRSIDDAAPDDGAPSKWTMRIYSSKESLSEMPNLSWLNYVGQEIVPAIDFRNAEDFRQVFHRSTCFVLDSQG
jgi:hypothetical protein